MKYYYVIFNGCLYFIYQYIIKNIIVYTICLLENPNFKDIIKNLCYIF